MKLELLHYPAKSGPERTPLLFVHGSFCGAWVWAEYFLPYFAERGFDAYAVSLRGHGLSEGREGLGSHGLKHYVEDVVQTMDRIGKPVVLLGHSMGGMVIQKAVERQPAAAAGMVMINSVPPAGLGASAFHMAMVAPDLLWQINLMQMFGQHLVSPEAMHRAFFSSRTPPAQVMHHMDRMQQESQQVILDLMNPLELPRTLPKPPPTFVLGGDCDVMIPPLALHQSALAYNADLEIMTGAPHGMMLDNCWPIAAGHIAAWLDKRGL